MTTQRQPRQLTPKRDAQGTTSQATQTAPIAQPTEGALLTLDALDIYIRDVNRALLRNAPPTPQGKRIPDYWLSRQHGLQATRKDGGRYTILAAIPELQQIVDAHDPATDTSVASSVRERYYYGTLHPPRIVPLDDESAEDAQATARASQRVKWARSDLFDKREPAWTHQLGSAPVPLETHWKRIGPAFEALTFALPERQRAAYATSGIMQTASGHWAYLRFGDDALTATGTTGDYRAELPLSMTGRLGSSRGVHYLSLLPASERTEAARDYRDTLYATLALTPSAPALAYTFLGLRGLAPLQPFIPPQHVMLAALSGSRKTAAACVALQGETDNWGRQQRVTIQMRDASNTAYAVSQVLAPLAGGIAVLDDVFYPGMSRGDTARQLKIYNSVTGGSISGMGALRGTWGHGMGGLGEEFIPRCSTIGTAELLPMEVVQSAGLLARIVVLKLERDTVDNTALTTAQTLAHGQASNRARSGYIRWLLSTLDAGDSLELRRGQESPLRTAIRATYDGAAPHARMCDNYADLEYGVALYLRYGIDSGYLTADEAAELHTAAHTALLHALTGQAALANSSTTGAVPEEAVPLFYDLLARLLREGRLAFSGIRESGSLPDTLPEGVLPADIGYTAGYSGGYTVAAHAWEVGAMSDKGTCGYSWELRISPTHWRTLYARLVAYAREHGAMLPTWHELDKALQQQGRMTRRQAQLWGGVNRCVILDVTSLWTCDEDEAADYGPEDDGPDGTDGPDKPDKPPSPQDAPDAPEGIDSLIAGLLDTDYRLDAPGAASSPQDAQTAPRRTGESQSQGQKPPSHVRAMLSDSSLVTLSVDGQTAQTYQGVHFPTLGAALDRLDALGVSMCWLDPHSTLAKRLSAADAGQMRTDWLNVSPRWEYVRQGLPISDEDGRLLPWTNVRRIDAPEQGVIHVAFSPPDAGWPWTPQDEHENETGTAARCLEQLRGLYRVQQTLGYSVLNTPSYTGRMFAQETNKKARYPYWWNAAPEDYRVLLPENALPGQGQINWRRALTADERDGLASGAARVVSFDRRSDYLAAATGLQFGIGQPRLEPVTRYDRATDKAAPAYWHVTLHYPADTLWNGQDLPQLPEGDCWLWTTTLDFCIRQGAILDGVTERISWPEHHAVLHTWGERVWAARATLSAEAARNATPAAVFAADAAKSIYTQTLGLFGWQKFDGATGQPVLLYGYQRRSWQELITAESQVRMWAKMRRLYDAGVRPLYTHIDALALVDSPRTEQAAQFLRLYPDNPAQCGAFRLERTHAGAGILATLTDTENALYDGQLIPSLSRRRGQPATDERE